MSGVTDPAHDGVTVKEYWPLASVVCWGNPGADKVTPGKGVPTAQVGPVPVQTFPETVKVDPPPPQGDVENDDKVNGEPSQAVSMVWTPQ
jgi:hypothetical protein